MSLMEMVLDPCVLPWDFGKQFQRSSTTVWDGKGSPISNIPAEAIPGLPGATQRVPNLIMHA